MGSSPCLLACLPLILQSKVLEMLTTLGSTGGIIVRLYCLQMTGKPSMNREDTHCDVVKI
ncbi:hypothetical protein A8A57_22025 [Lelliottia amnigena]|nr:hypothetical protein A8A57_22025 [Lelliottia amnigena]